MSTYACVRSGGKGEKLSSALTAAVENGNRSFACSFARFLHFATFAMTLLNCIGVASVSSAWLPSSSMTCSFRPAGTPTRREFRAHACAPNRSPGISLTPDLQRVRVVFVIFLVLFWARFVLIPCFSHLTSFRDTHSHTKGTREAAGLSLMSGLSGN